jgi:SAM-dependent methyltransferase
VQPEGEMGGVRQTVAAPLGQLSARVRTAVMEGGTRLLLERRLRAQTIGHIELPDLHAHPHRQFYLPSPWLSLVRALPRSEVNEHDVFVDFGCGMGRMVLEAALFYPFARVVGVELSPELARVAEANVARNRHRFRARDVQIAVTDVLDYTISDDVTVAYFFNPFEGPIFAHVIGALIASVDRNPRRLRIVYQVQAERQMLLDTGRVRQIGSGRSLLRRRPASGLGVYEVVPAGA